MATRTTKQSVVFHRPFTFPGITEQFPAGKYETETDEELLEGLSFSAYRRFQTLFFVPMDPGNGRLSRMLTIDPNALDAALERDKAINTPASKQLTAQKPSPNTLPAGKVGIDRLAMDRAENEGMMPQTQ
ncbi:MAG: hypothetical protein RIM72_21335 [Alphaproteobacteria bacterium]